MPGNWKGGRPAPRQGVFCRWFRYTALKGLLLVYRDLRLEDQTALNEALREADELAVLWIYDEKAEGIPWDQRVRSHGLRARLTAFKHFNGRLKTIGHQATLLTGDYTETLIALKSEIYDFDKLYYNRFYDRVGNAMTLAAEVLAEKYGVGVSVSEDIMLFEPTRILKKDGTPYQMFTPYYRQWLERFRSAAPMGMTSLPEIQARSVAVKGLDLTVFNSVADRDKDRDKDRDMAVVVMPHPALDGGYEAMAAQWKAFLESPLSRFSEDRDYPAKQATSGMSVYLNSGMLSPRQFVSELVKVADHEAVLRQYVWREFYLQLLHHQPHVLDGAMRPEYAGVRWEENPAYFEAWCEGKTGVPIVDAAMRCLKSEGRMHNRLRMIAASYLVKDLHVNWQLGERYFCEMLVDYEPALNNGGWQWSASTGTDAQPYFRVFNPWQQSLRYDAEAAFMKKWLPEVEKASAELFHKPGGLIAYGYPQVIVDHAAAVRMTKALYQEARQAYARQDGEN
ncbi:cryptochrome/photolyase family protein [Acidaminobacter hydrogenoformans]|nr:deoxyribodipyrimidine photo-lyase [Acidaminobacter hydrogenoformans]